MNINSSHTQTQQQHGRFVVRLPTKMDPKQLGSTRLSAERRLHAIERRLERDPELKVLYHNFMKEHEDLGRMEPVNSQEGKNTCHFLPHHPVFKETSSTTRPRIAFGRSAKPSNGTQHNNRRVLFVDRFFYCFGLDTGSTKQMEGTCRQQSCSH